MRLVYWVLGPCRLRGLILGRRGPDIHLRRYRDRPRSTPERGRGTHRLAECSKPDGRSPLDLYGAKVAVRHRRGSPHRLVGGPQSESACARRSPRVVGGKHTRRLQRSRVRLVHLGRRLRLARAGMEGVIDRVPSALGLSWRRARRGNRARRRTSGWRAACPDSPYACLVRCHHQYKFLCWRLLDCVRRVPGLASTPAPGPGVVCLVRVRPDRRADLPGVRASYSTPRRPVDVMRSWSMSRREHV